MPSRAMAGFLSPTNYPIAFGHWSRHGWMIGVRPYPQPPRLSFAQSRSGYPTAPTTASDLAAESLHRGARPLHAVDRDARAVDQRVGVPGCGRDRQA
jgi:hypothetical protein